MSRRAQGIALALGVALVLLPAPVAARERRPPPDSKQVETVGRALYEKLERAQQALAAERFDEAERRLLDILESKKLNPRERALVLQTLGYAYSGADHNAEAIRAFEQALSLEALSERSVLNTRFNLGRLYLLDDQPDRGIEMLLAWFEEAHNPGASAHMTLAAAFAQRGDTADALLWAERGLARMDEPNETWMRLGAQLNVAAEEWERAALWLARVIEVNPRRKSDWTLLVSVYGQLEQQEKALAVLSLAERQGFLDTSEERKQLARLQLANGIPFAAGELLEKELGAGRIDDSRRSWELLANAWSLAREDARALEPLARAAAEVDDGRLWLRLGQVHADAGRWAEAQSAIERALARGGLEDEGAAQLLLGVSFYERGHYGDARLAFRRALAHETSRASARAWLEVIESRS